MKKVLILLFVLGLSSCASNKKKDSVDLEEISNKDFSSKSEVRYKKEEDILKNSTDKNFAILGDESAQRMEDPSDLEQLNALDQITISCYEKQFDKAFGLIKAKTKTYKRNPIFWNQVGTCFMLKGERRKALLFYNKALEFKSSYAPAYNNLGFMYKSEGEDQKALVAFTRSKKANRYAKTPLFNLGNIYLEYGLYDQSLRTFKGLYNIDNKDIDIINGIAISLLMKGEVSESLNYYSKINSDYYEQPHIGINYAVALYRSNKRKESREILEDIPQDKLKNWKTYYKQVSNIVGVK